MHESRNTIKMNRHPASQTQPLVFGEKQTGALLIGLIITMVVLSLLGAGMVYIFSSSTLNPISGNYAQRAYYNAEAGFRYVTALYRHSSEDKTVFNPYVTPQVIQLPGGGTATVTVSGLSSTFVPAKANYVSGGGNSLIVSLSTGSFPAAPGFFIKNSETTVYRYTNITTNDDGNIVLSYITPSLSAASGDTFTTKEKSTIVSKGSFGEGFLNVSRTVTYTWALSASGSGDQPPDEFDPDDFSGGQKPEYKVTPISANDFTLTSGKSTVTEDRYMHPQGGTYLRTDLIVSGYDTLGSGSTEVRYHYVPFKHNAANLGFYQAWQLNNQLLSYDVQVKISTTPPVSYGSMGFMFRTIQQKSGSRDYYTGYGISLLRYANLTSSTTDYIPSAIKPNLDGATQSNRMLLVLWEQTGLTTWRWLAYKKLHLLSPGGRRDDWDDRTTTEVYDNWVRGSQYSGDGYFVHDDTTLMIRVIEKRVGGVRVNDIQLFFGDARWTSNNQNGRTQDNNAYNTHTKDSDNMPIFRYGYEQRFSPSAAEGLWKWPSLPDISSTNWNPADNDWFSAVAWDRVNTASGITAVMMQDEAGQYSIIRDGSYTSEGFTNNQTKIPELVFHTFGNLNEGSYFVDARSVHFRDFAVRLLRGGSSSAGSPWIGPIQE